MDTQGLKTADGRWIARRLYLARSFSERLRGVLKLGALEPDSALMISPCTSIHTFAVGFPIDAVFLNSQLRILRLAPNIPPWRIRLAPPGTRHVLELPAGTLERLHLDVGTFVCVQTDTDERERCSMRPRASCSTSDLQFSLRLPSESIRRCDGPTISRPRAQAMLEHEP